MNNSFLLITILSRTNKTKLKCCLINLYSPIICKIVLTCLTDFIDPFLLPRFHFHCISHFYLPIVSNFVSLSSWTMWNPFSEMMQRNKNLSLPSLMSWTSSLSFDCEEIFHSFCTQHKLISRENSQNEENDFHCFYVNSLCAFVFCAFQRVSSLTQFWLIQSTEIKWIENLWRLFVSINFYLFNAYNK